MLTGPGRSTLSPQKGALVRKTANIHDHYVGLNRGEPGEPRRGIWSGSPRSSLLFTPPVTHRTSVETPEVDVGCLCLGNLLTVCMGRERAVDTRLPRQGHGEQRGHPAVTRGKRQGSQTPRPGVGSRPTALPALACSLPQGEVSME